MVSSEERLKILQMIQEGKITPEEGIQRLEELDTVAQNMGSQANNEIPSQPVGRTAKWLRVRITDTDSGKVRVNVRLPISVVNAGMKMGARFSPEVQGLDNDRLLEILHSGEVGKIVDVFDDEDGEHVEVFIE